MKMMRIAVVELFRAKETLINTTRKERHRQHVHIKPKGSTLHLSTLHLAVHKDHNARVPEQ